MLLFGSVSDQANDHCPIVSQCPKSQIKFTPNLILFFIQEGVGGEGRPPTCLEHCHPSPWPDRPRHHHSNHNNRTMLPQCTSQQWPAFGGIPDQSWRGRQQPHRLDASARGYGGSLLRHLALSQGQQCLKRKGLSSHPYSSLTEIRLNIL